MSTPVIKNIDALGTTQLRKDALAVLEVGYESVNTERVIRDEVEIDGDDICIKDRNICMTDYDRIFFIGIGKCAVDASLVFEDLLGDRITDGIVLDVKHGIFKRLHSYVGTHPFPSEANIAVTRDIVSMLAGVTEHDLVFVVVSGGGSSLLCLPHDMYCETLQEITQALWKQGANITEVNTVRKHLSEIHGGQLAKHAYPATVVSFIFSDVPGNDMSMIASGPTVMDETTVADAVAVLAKYDVMNQCRMANCDMVETPKEAKYFERVLNILLVTNERALSAMQEKAKSLGYNAVIKDIALEGYAHELGEKLSKQIMPKKSCFLYGGETTVRIQGEGIGGRNQEFALAAVGNIPDDRVLVAAASDGHDNTDIAGAICDAGDIKRAQALGADPDIYLARNDSFHFWEKVGGNIQTGNTGINVADFYFIMTG